MTQYTKSTNFTSKDSLASGNPLKIVRGSEIDTEFNNIATAVATKADLLSPTFTGVPLAPTAAYGTSSTQIATTAFITAALQAIYPVGSIYTNASVSTNPATLFGFGTWVAFGGGRVPVGITAGDASFDVLEETGGSKDAALPSHTHTVSSSGTTGGQSSDHSHGATSTVSDPGHAHSLTQAVTVNSGGGTAGGYVGNTGLATVSGTNGAATGISVSTSLGGVSSGHTHDVTVSGTTAASGVSATNANLQPYVVVAMWKRVS